MKPTPDQLKIALRKVELMRAEGDDPDFLAQTLSYLHRRDEVLERILVHLERFLQFGLPEEEHAKLVRLIDEAKVQERMEKGAGKGDFGL